MNSNLVPKQIKNIHVVHDLLNDGHKKTYMLYLPFEPDIVKFTEITSDCVGIDPNYVVAVKVFSNIDNQNEIIGNVLYDNGPYVYYPDKIITAKKTIPNMLEFTVLDNRDNDINITNVSRALFVYGISFIKY